MIKILLSTPTEFDSTSFYRCFGIIHNLNRKMGGRLQIDNFRNGTYNWSNIAGYDILFFHRPAINQHLQIAAYAKELGVKVWIDHDDNLFNLPLESRAYDNYTLDIKKIMISIMNLADIVTTSTAPLAEFFTENLGITTPVEVIPNALNDDFFKISDTFHGKQNFVWRGSETHIGDLFEYTEPIFQAMSVSKAPFYFLGYRPWLIMDNFTTDKLIYLPPQDPIHYHAQLKGLKPHLMHVPLSDNALNRSKSNIAWIEATFAGAVTLAPDTVEWQRPGVINYKDHDEYKFNLITPPENLESLWKESRDFIKENLLLSVVNQKRVELIEKLLTK